MELEGQLTSRRGDRGKEEAENPNDPRRVKVMVSALLVCGEPAAGVTACEKLVLRQGTGAFPVIRDGLVHA